MKVRYGIVGFGRFAEKAIMPAIRQSYNSEPVAIQNRSLTKAKQLAALHGIPFAFESVEALVAERSVDAVFIASPNSLHCPETIVAARAGKHVLCEKPMAMNVVECEAMIAACRENNVKLMVGHMVRLSPIVERVRDLVQLGVVGHVVRVRADFVYDGRLSSRQWLLDRTIAGGGPIFDVGVHCLDTLRFILHDEVVSLKGELVPTPTATRTERSAQIVLRFSRGTIGTIFCSYDSPIRESALEVFGTDARLSAMDFTVGSRHVKLDIAKGREDGAVQHESEEFDVPNLYVREVNLFSECILNNTEPPLTGENGLRNQRVLDEAMNLERR
jgi:predicted dehydrogenase